MSNISKNAPKKEKMKDAKLWIMHEVKDALVSQLLHTVKTEVFLSMPRRRIPKGTWETVV